MINDHGNNQIKLPTKLILLINTQILNTRAKSTKVDLKETERNNVSFSVAGYITLLDFLNLLF